MASVKLRPNTLRAPKRGENEFDDTVSDQAQYGRVQFWDARYAQEHEPWEWYYPYEFFRETISENVSLSDKVMVAGCGSSNMLGDMADDGFRYLTGADISRVVITQLKYRYKNVPAISLFQGNITDTDLPEGSFDAIIDKALFDSLLCTQTSATTIAQYIFEVERLLTKTGVFIIISHGTPEQRLSLLEQYDIDEPYFTPWIIEVQGVS
jgi:ubiquinone/menaquinone biosynthesis C-methylase UbiE